MFNRRCRIRIGLVTLLGAMPTTALAADRFDLGLRLNAVGGGVRMCLGARSALEIALRADRHIADWELLDLESGATGRVDDYLLRGVSIGYVFRFPRGGPEPPSRDRRDPRGFAPTPLARFVGQLSEKLGRKT